MESTVRSTSTRTRVFGDQHRQYRRLAAQFGLALLMLPLAACQGVAGTAEPPQPRLAIDSAAVANAASARAASGTASSVTYTVQRGTITDSLSIPGRIVPAVASQVTIQRPGTVTAIHVHSGQAVKKRDPLVEVTVDDSVVQDLQTRATLADLEYETQAAKVTEMKRGAGPEQLAAARAEVAKAEADLERAQVEDEIAQQQALQDRQSLASVKDDHDRQIALQELAVQTANDELDAAQTELKRTQELAQLARADAAASKADNQTLAQRIEAATRSAQQATDATRAAQRNVDESTAKLEHAKQADRRAAQVDLDQARDDLAQAQAVEQARNQDLQRLNAASALASRLTAANMQVDVVEARVRDAQRKIKAATLRLEALRAVQSTDSEAQNQLKSKLAAVNIRAAKAALEIARSKLDVLQQGPTADDLAREEARAAILQDVSNAAHQALLPTVVAVAPFDGSVVAVDVRLGQSVDARTVAARVAGEGGLSIVAQASESDVTQLAVNQKVNVGFPSLGENVSTEGSIVEISGAAAPSSTLSSTGDSKITYPVTVEISSPPQALKLGMSALLNVNLRSAQDVIYVPSNAVRKVNQQNLVTTIDSNGQLADTPIRAGDVFGTNIEVLSGLKEGDVVAVFAPSAAVRTSK
jgi:RND family efflux transporter MFP subunit